MCITGQTPSTTHAMIALRQKMLVTLLVLIALIAMLIGSRLHVPGSVERSQLGRMSEQWIAEYRASHLS